MASRNDSRTGPIFEMNVLVQSLTDGNARRWPSVKHCRDDTGRTLGQLLIFSWRFIQATHENFYTNIFIHLLTHICIAYRENIMCSGVFNEGKRPRYIKFRRSIQP